MVLFLVQYYGIKEEKEYIFTNCLPKENKNQMKYITGLQIGTAVRASSSFPGFFCPCKIGNHCFIDGGALDNIPIEEIRKQGADKIIAVKFGSDPFCEEENIMDIVMKVIDIMGNKIIEEHVNSSDVLLTIQTEKMGLLDTENLDVCYQAGYSCAMEQMEQIKKMLEEKRT